MKLYLHNILKYLSILFFCFIHLSHKCFAKYNRYSLKSYQNNKNYTSINYFRTYGKIICNMKNGSFYLKFNYLKYGKNIYKLFISDLLKNFNFWIFKEDEKITFSSKNRLHVVKNSKNIILEISPNFYFPISNFDKWITGLPGNIKTYSLDTKNRLKIINYNYKGINYSVRFDEYFNFNLPRIIKLIKQDGQNINIFIKNWIIL